MIKVLPQALCDQIAAGEVLERASSAIKELIENALDASATSIEIELEDGGKKRLSVTDNGVGMSPQDAKLCVLRHATSKINSTADLARISTMGFRGEALASMAAVSKMTILTQKRGADSGTFLRIEASEILECREASAPSGTQIVVSELFFNTPARLKFLKTTGTEQRRVSEVIDQFALACPEVHFKLSVDGKVKADYPAHKNLGDRIYSVLGKTLHANLYPIEDFVFESISVRGYFVSPDYAQSSTGRIFTYVNQRIVREKTMISAIIQAYREFLHGKQPTVVLFLNIDLAKVDVNVHPSKHEIRFENSDLVFKAVYRALRQSLEKTPWIGDTAAQEPLSMQYFDMLPDSAYRSPEYDLNRQKAVIQPSYAPHFSSDYAGHDRPTPGFFEEAVTGFGLQFSHPDKPLSAAPFSLGPALLPLDDQELSTGYFSSLRYLGQIAQTYLVCADGNNLVVVDQHAAHERINFERLKLCMDTKATPASQNLIFPIHLALEPQLVDVLEEHLAFFIELGFQIDALGEQSYVVRAVPDSLLKYDYVSLIRMALGEINEHGRSHQFEEIRDQILSTMACHSSIRAGQAMNAEQVYELFRLMDATGFRSNCPHGRPVHFSLGLQEIEKRFLR